MPSRSFTDANALQKMTRAAGSSRLGAKVGAQSIHRIDRLVLRLTGGRRTLTGTLIGLPTVQVTTIGARSRLSRTVLLLGLTHPEGLSVIASNFGKARHPGWYHNLLANPNAIVGIDGERWRASARVATPAEREEIWACALDVLPGWKNYQASAGSREIEAFVLMRQD